MQATLFGEGQLRPARAYRSPPQLLKWVGNKHRFAYAIASQFPDNIRTYFEPFLGSGAVLGTLAPQSALASDSFPPLIEIWRALKETPDLLKQWYGETWVDFMAGDKVEQYELVKARYNASPNGADLLFLSRSCYGGVVRFRKADGYMSTPCGAHNPITPDSFAKRVDEWHRRTAHTTFERMEYHEAMDLAGPGDVVYCDPPYSHSQAILYGAQSFSISRLLASIEHCKQRGAYVILSIDGTKKSGNVICDVPVPDGLFEREIFVDCGRSMLKRFKMNGQSLEGEVVADRLLLTY